MNIRQALEQIADNPYKRPIKGLVLGILLLALVIQLFSTKPESNHLEQVLERGILKVVTRVSPTTYYDTYQGPDGLEFQLANLFAEQLGVELEMIPAESLTQILNMLESGEADLAAAGLSITKDRLQSLNFAPPYDEVSKKLVFKQGKRWPRDISQLNGELRVLADSSHSQQLLELKTEYPNLSWTETNNETSEDLLTDVLDETIEYTIADSNELALNRRFYPELAIGFSIGEADQIAWAFAKDKDDSLRARSLNFFEGLRNSGTLANVLELNYGHVEDFDYVGTRRFLKAAETKLPKYIDYFKAAAGDDMDWLLLAAISYQESHWNPRAKSPTGVRGMMMITLNTAKQVGVKNRLDPKQSIEGGAKYFRSRYARIPDRIKEPERTWFALAGYNIGWGHVEDARILTAKQGGDADRWADVKERLPLLRQRKYYKQTRYGYARGDEPVRYVDNIRRYYETLKWLFDEQKDQADLVDNNKSNSPTPLQPLATKDSSKASVTEQSEPTEQAKVDENND
jgi:membrane-bound lytic murein transglycosylase F